MKAAGKVVLFLAGAACAVSAALGLIGLVFGWSWAWTGHTSAFYFWPERGHYSFALVVIMAFAALLLVGFRRVPGVWPVSYKHVLLLCGAVFIAAVLMRSVPLLFFSKDAAPYSDFQWAWERATGAPISGAGNNHRWYPAWMNYSLWLQGIVSVFGKQYWTVLMTGIVFDGFTAIGIFALLKIIEQPLAVSLLGAVLYVINPSSIIYGMTSTPEHISIACYVWSVALILHAWQCASWCRGLLWALVAGGLSGFGNAVKPFALVIFVALVLVVLVVPSFKKGRPLFLLAIWVLTAHGVAAVWTTTASHMYDVRLDNATAYPHYLNVGLNRQGEGQIHVGTLSRLYVKDLSAGKSLEEACAASYDRVMADWRGHCGEIPSFIVRKMVWAWQDDLTPLRYFYYSVPLKDSWGDAKSVVYNGLRSYMPAVLQMWYIVFAGLLAFCIFRFAFRSGVPSLGLVVVCLILLGFHALVFLGEAQSRYKCLVLPFACVIAAIALRKENRNVSAE